MITGKEIGGLLFAMHTHGDLVADDEIVYREEDVIALLKKLGFPEPEWGDSIPLDQFSAEAPRSGSEVYDADILTAAFALSDTSRGMQKVTNPLHQVQLPFSVGERVESSDGVVGNVDSVDSKYVNIKSVSGSIFPRLPEHCKKLSHLT